MNNTEKLWRAIGEIDETLLDPPPKWRIPWGCLAALAACVCLLATAILARPATPASPALQKTEQPEQTAPSPPPAPAALPGIDIPAITLPTQTEAGIEMDMIGCLVYQGKVYTQAESIYDADAIARVTALLGDRIGHAKGTIDEWSTQDDYAQALASTYDGDVYTMQGYDPGFRLCIVMADAGETICIQLMEQLNGITLTSGASLLEERLRLSLQPATATYITHADWNAGNNDRHDATFTQAQWDAFYQAACAGDFEHLYDDAATIYTDGRAQAHLYLSMADGTEVELRLLAGGYVGYQNLGWYFVRIPSAVFDPVFAACQG